MPPLMQFQDSSCTLLDRYPEVFERSAALVPAGLVLSFGCSTGEEVRSLKLHNSAWEVHGVERDPESLRAALEVDPGGVYAASVHELPAEGVGCYDLVFCMSVLCRFPPVDPEPYFSFGEFEVAIGVLDASLAPGGVLVLWNAQYDFRETAQSEGYEVFDLGLERGLEGFAPDECLVGDPGSGFVSKYTRLGELLLEPVPLAFRKLFKGALVENARP